ncbi:hypothetical protein KIKIMORA_00330 [Brevundimonas phage vB_BpoS-Kikimora]|uniref:Uncharacterized protein n=1 Tax=Brevundimonas phage vB_BpoS-Kikimora TaxID=2948601 RepID=A0A9E7MRG2_9CAUD|nr:hypothetical protein KIKIMORA_00330 [Brevundimonas phage vB_BpoS-Kikimora]
MNRPIKDVRTALQEAVAVMSDLAEAWPQDSLPAQSLCVRLANAIHDGREALTPVSWRDVGPDTPSQTPLLVRFNRPGVVNEVPVVALMRFETDRWIGGGIVRNWYAFGAEFARIATPAQWRPLYEDDAGQNEVLREALVQADLTIRAFPGTDQSDVAFIRKALGEGVN